MLLVGSSNAMCGFEIGIKILESGGSALDAIEAVTRVVEDNPDDHTVGYGGYPNLNGVVELDASIIDGTTRSAGAVGGLRGYRAAITVARAVMERLPHVLVVGEGAAALAAEIGLAPENLLTPEAEQVWRDGIEGRLEKGQPGSGMAAAVADLVSDPERTAAALAGLPGETGAGGVHDRGTVDVMARDSEGRIASAVSTSGWAWKFPGRLGDSPIVGAGNYADDRYGAAACTGFGELALRAGVARMVVARMAEGDTVSQACGWSMHDVADLNPPADAMLNIVAMKADGTHGAATLQAGPVYAVWTPEMGEPGLLPREHFPL